MDLTLTGGISVNAGVSDAVIAMNVAADSPITVDVADADAQLTIDTLSGSGNLTKTGGGSLALAADTHSGTTTVSAGTLLVGSLPSVFADALKNGVSSTRPYRAPQRSAIPAIPAARSRGTTPPSPAVRSPSIAITEPSLGPRAPAASPPVILPP